MQEFDFYQDVKVTCWVRQHFSVEAENMEEAVKMVERFKDEDISSSEDGPMIDETEWLLDTCGPLSVKENGGFSTIEVYNSNKELICKNGK